MKSQKTTLPTKVERIWVEVDVSSKPLGRVSTVIANALRGKLKRDFTPHMDMGDFVVAVNVDQIKLTGRKLEQKKYHRYTGFPGGLRTRALKDIITNNPEFVLRRAVLNMLDNNKLRRPIMRRLKMVKGTAHDFKIDKKI